MSAVRVYLPLSREQLAMWVDGEVEVSVGHAVTDHVREELADCDEEEQEFAVLMLAGVDALELVADGGWRRLIAVAEVPATPLDLSLVRLERPLHPGDLRALYIDETEARATLLELRAGLPDLDLDKIDECELLWYGPEEAAEVLGILSSDA